MRYITNVLVVFVCLSIFPLSSSADDTTSLGSAVEQLGEHVDDGNVDVVTLPDQTAEDVPDTAADRDAANSDGDAVQTTILDPLEGE